MAKAEKADEGGGGGGGAARPAAPVLVLVLVLAPAKDEAARRAWGTGPKAAAVATAPAQRRGDSIPIPAIGGGEGRGGEGGGAMGDLGAMGPAVAHTLYGAAPGRPVGRQVDDATDREFVNPTSNKYKKIRAGVDRSTVLARVSIQDTPRCGE